MQLSAHRLACEVVIIRGHPGISQHSITLNRKHGRWSPGGWGAPAGRGSRGSRGWRPRGQRAAGWRPRGQNPRNPGGRGGACNNFKKFWCRVRGNPGIKFRVDSRFQSNSKKFSASSHLVIVPSGSTNDRVVLTLVGLLCNCLCSIAAR